MAGITLDAAGEKITSILRTNLNNLVVRLVKSPLAEMPQLSTLDEASFPGYAPRRSSAWRVTAETGTDPVLQIANEFTWRVTSAAESQEILGVVITLPADAAEESVISFVSFPAPVPMGGPGDALLLRLTLDALDGEVDNIRGAVVVPWVQVLSWKGGVPLFALSGEDLLLLRALQSHLEAALKRDSVLPDLSKRSQRSRLPLVPEGEVELQTAVTLLRARLQTLLGDL